MTPPSDSELPEFLQPHFGSIAGMQQLGELFYERGWNRATSGGYCVVVRRDPMELLVTVGRSAKDRLQTSDFVLVDSDGNSIHQQQAQSASSTKWHCTIARSNSVGAILHTHSVWTSVLAPRFSPLGGVLLEGAEMLQGISSIANPAQPVWLPILSESNRTQSLDAQVQAAVESVPSIQGFLIQQQGLFTWGQDLEEAVRHCEIIEFLSEVVVRQSQLS